MFINEYRHKYIFPGHALLIAVCIMEKYPSLEEARRRENSEYSNALTDNDIPGAGGCVYSALRILEMDVEEAIKTANDLWQGECESGYKDRYDNGLNQAKVLEPIFRKMKETWK